MSEFVDNIITISTKPFKRKKREALDEIANDQNELFEPGTTKSDPKTATISEIPGKLSDFADMGSMSNVISKLQKMALPEKWDLDIEENIKSNRHQILLKYFYHAFGRALVTSQIVVDECRTVVIFNTGLVDCHYQPIYVFLTKNKPRSKQEWKFNDFFVLGSGIGKRILEHFNPCDLPKAPQYFDDICDLVYDFRKGEPTPDYHHCIIDNIHRWPQSVHEHECPAEWAKIKDEIKPGIADKEKSELFQQLRNVIKENVTVYQRYKLRFDSSIDLAFKKVTWNYKTAVPMYWSIDKKIHLLLPLCLDTEDRVDAALVVNKTAKGYIGDTLFTLDMAYANARLVCRPECEWLST